MVDIFVPFSSGPPCRRRHSTLLEAGHHRRGTGCCAAVCPLASNIEETSARHQSLMMDFCSAIRMLHSEIKMVQPCPFWRRQWSFWRNWRLFHVVPMPGAGLWLSEKSVPTDFDPYEGRGFCKHIGMWLSCGQKLKKQCIVFERNGTDAKWLSPIATC